MNLESLANRVADHCRITGSFIRREASEIKSSQIEEKSRNNFVTYVDKQAEEMLISGLLKFLPEAGLTAEEGTRVKTGCDLEWIIDPLDGTTNFIHGVPIYSISVALADQGTIVLGVVYEVNNAECFYASKNSLAYLNGDRISVTHTRKIEDSLLATGFPYSNFTLLSQYLAYLQDVMQSSHGVRRLGSAAADLAYVACGRFDGFFEYDLKPWDVAAGSIIVQRAGGIVSDFRGTDDFINGGEIIAANPLIYNELLKKAKDYFGRG